MTTDHAISPDPATGGPTRASGAVAAWCWAPIAVVAAAHLWFLWRGADGVSAATQVLLMPALAVVLLALPRARRGPWWPWALGALAGSWIGDSLPQLMPAGGDAPFLAMVGGFAITQVLWVVAFTRVPGRTPRAWTALLVLVAAVMLGLTVPAAGMLAPAVCLYAVLLVATAHYAARHGWAGLAGGALFVVSDALIALGAFRGELVDFAHRDVAVMVTYIAAQVLLTGTACALPAGSRDRRSPRPAR